MNKKDIIKRHSLNTWGQQSNSSYLELVDFVQNKIEEKLEFKFLTIDEFIIN